MALQHNWYEEKRSAYLYSIMAKHETNILHKKLFLDLSQSAEAQAKVWENKIIQNILKRLQSTWLN